MSVSPARSNRLAAWLSFVLCGFPAGYALCAHELGNTRRELPFRLALLAIDVFLLSLLAHWVFFRLLPRRLAIRSRRSRRCWIVGAMLGGAVLTGAMLVPRSVPVWMPLHTVEITALGQKNPQAHSQEVWVMGLQWPNGSRTKPSRFKMDSGWDIREGMALHYGTQPASMRWIGRAPAAARVAFNAHPWCGLVRVTIDGHQQDFDLYRATGQVFEVPLGEHEVWWVHLQQMLGRWGEFVAFGLILLVFGLWLMSRPVPAVTPAPVGWRWVYYALPCVIVWTLTLAAYWPGMLSSDSVDQWMQMKQWVFWDGHPVMHTLFNWAATRVWDSPAAVAIVQILALSTLGGWALARMRALGMPRWLAWGTCLVFALMPANNTLVITLWKDVGYAIGMLWFTLLVFEIVLSRGAWLRRPGRFFLLVLSGAVVCLFRHNGAPVILGTLLALLVAYRRQWLPLAATTLAIFLSMWAVRGPLYRSLNITQSVTTGLWVWPVMDALAAHMNAGTPLPEPEAKFLNGVLPDRWPYDPANINPLARHPKLNMPTTDEGRHRLLQALWVCTWERPEITLKHVLDVSSFVWRIGHPANTWYSSCLGTVYDGRVVSIFENNIGLVRKPLVSGWDERWARVIMRSQEQNVFWLFWRPAMYMYLAIAGGLIAAARARDWRWLLVLAPVLINSAVFALITPAHDFRYQYGTFIVSILLSGFMLLCIPLHGAEEEMPQVPEESHAPVAAG